MNLKGKTVLVTGSSKGIGKAIALAFVKEGANVIFNYRDSKREAEKALEEANYFGGDHFLMKADMSKEGFVQRLFEEIENKYKTLDILVNNAGDSRSIDLVKSPLEDWQYQLDNNFLSAVIASKEFLKMKGSEDLRKIINISSVWGFDDKCHPDFMAYGASKAALNSFTKSMAKKYAPYVLVNAIAPGYVLTPHWGEMTEEEMQSEADQQLIGRFIDPDEIALGALLIAYNDSMTGSIVTMDGGIGLKSI